MRAGHTEASVDLARLAGLYPAAVICEIMNDDGTMARMPDLVPFAQRHGLKIGAIEDLIAYRLQNERLVRAVSQTHVSTANAGNFDLHVFETTVEPGEHLALVKGDLNELGPVLVRVHAVNVLADLLGVGKRGKAGTQLESAMHAIDKEGRGVIVLIRDLRPRSLSERVDQRPQSPSNAGGVRERRQVEIGVGSQILRELGVTDMVLLTNEPAHVYVGLEGFGLRIVGTRRIE
jgi:3,4-dihydroxy 2-butanone 4-phosphate synthase/GTP cyclohydrolase II